MHNYKELKIWQKARLLVKDCYALTLIFPKDEKFGLISQIQRAAVSIPANIELETLFMLAADLNFINNDKCDPILTKIQEIQKMIYSFKNTIIDRTNKL